MLFQMSGGRLGATAGDTSDVELCKQDVYNTNLREHCRGNFVFEMASCTTKKPYKSAKGGEVGAHYRDHVQQRIRRHGVQEKTRNVECVGNVL